MSKPTGPTNLVLRKLIEDIRNQGYKEKSNFLINLAKKLETPRRRKIEVSLTKINRFCKEGEIVLVPGKVLDGILDKKLTIVAVKFSSKAKHRIEKSGSNIISIRELIKKNPKGSKVRLIT
ncbi:MAG: 50S ribosomal protein L18e [Candidatus Aenigmatarchaeota archaeon]